MSRSHVLDAIILQTHDVGEADRFCILFTKERGKLAVRARGVRKPGSRLGGTLLPLQRVTAHVREGSAGYLITDATLLSTAQRHTMRSFLQAQQGIELLLLSLHDDEPLPELFDATRFFLERCHTHEGHAVLPYTLRMLHLLGLLPEGDDIRFSRCTPSQSLYARCSMHGEWSVLPELSLAEKAFFSGLCAELLSEALSRAPKAGVIAQSMM